MPDGLSGIVDRLMKAEESIKEYRSEVKELRRISSEEKLRADKLEMRQEKQGERLGKVENNYGLMDIRMKAMESTLTKIEENTTFTRRQVTGIVIGAAATAVIGGAVALIYGMIGGGIV